MDKTKPNNLDVFSSNHEPYWIASVSETNFSPLREDIAVDVAIIGGGIVGITTAYLLKQKGLKVAIIEANKIAHGTSGHTTAKITSQHGLIYDKLIKNVGEEKARLYAEANEYAIHFIADLVKQKNIDCDFCCKPSYVFTQSQDYVQKIQDEVKAATSLGIKASFHESLPLPFKVLAAVKFENQAQFHPLKYLLTLAKEVPGNGSYIFENTTVVDVEQGETCTVITREGKKVRAPKVIVASHFPCYDGLGMYFARMHQEKSYSIGVKVKDKFPEGVFINAEAPTRSLRSQRFEDGEIILISGDHHKTGEEKETNIHYENLAKFAIDNFNVESILFRWSTQDCITLDSLPYVGYLKSDINNIFVATGFGKWGMTNGTASSIILTDLITKGENKWASAYDPSRFNTTSLGKLISQNADVARKFIGGKLAPVPRNIELKRGEAKVVDMGGERVGAYRDEEGTLHVVDITCTHLGCELVWNEAETTWDCPCHGSRFNYDGTNVESPAFKPLNHLSEGKNDPDPNIF